MTIDEAIEHELKIAKSRRKTFDKCNERKNSYACRLCFETQTCLEYAEEHEQLAEWLEELKAIKDGGIPIIHGKAELELHDKAIRNEAIDDFAEKLSIAFDETDIEEYGFYPKNLVRQVAEQLKAGGENDNLRR